VRREERREDGRPWARRPGRAVGTAPVRLSLRELRATLAPAASGPLPAHRGFLALRLSSGRWVPPLAEPSDLVIYVAAGALLRTRAPVVDLLLERDLSEVDLTSDERWKVLSPTPAVIALLPPDALAELGHVPGMMGGLLHAQRRQHERNLELRSIVGIYDVEARIAAFFRHLARHVGRPEGGATRIPLALEQRRVEEILCAGHTQATTAFRSLVRGGVLVHDAGGWLVGSSAPNTSARRSGSPPNPIARERALGLPARTPAA